MRKRFGRCVASLLDLKHDVCSPFELLAAEEGGSKGCESWRDEGSNLRCIEVVFPSISPEVNGTNGTETQGKTEKLTFCSCNLSL